MPIPVIRQFWYIRKLGSGNLRRLLLSRYRQAAKARTISANAEYRKIRSRSQGAGHMYSARPSYFFFLAVEYVLFCISRNTKQQSACLPVCSLPHARICVHAHLPALLKSTRLALRSIARAHTGTLAFSRWPFRFFMTVDISNPQSSSMTLSSSCSVRVSKSIGI